MNRTIGNDDTRGKVQSIGDARTLQSDFREIRIGTKIGPDGRYAIKDILGKGGMGEVYLALDEISKTDVAIKLVPREVSISEDEMEQVRKNFALVRNLHHPNIAAVTALERLPSGEYILIMEAVLGRQTLQKARLSRKNERFSVPEAIRICKQVADALDYAHQQKVIHRDVKPSNVLLTLDGQVKLTDFGLAAQIISSMNRVSMLPTRTSGTRPYMAPEQWEGRPQDAKTDQWALGVLFYELVTGRLPFPADDLGVLERQVTEKTPHRPAALSSAQWRALLRSLSKTQGKRYSTCSQFLDVLAGTQRVSRTRNVVVAASVLLICAAVGLAFFWKIRQTEAAWRVTQATGTESAYNGFASIYTWSPHAGQARQKAAELKAESERRAAEELARQKMETAWRTAQTIDTETAYNEFVSTYVNSPHTEQARQKVAEAFARQEMETAWTKAQATDTETAYNQFAAAYATSPYVSQARQKAAKLKAESDRRAAEELARQKMETAWTTAQATDTETAYNQFSAAYATSPYALQARQKATKLKAERERSEAQELTRQKRVASLKRYAGRYRPASPAYFGEVSNTGWVDIEVGDDGSIRASGKFSEAWTADPMYPNLGEDETKRVLSGQVTGIEILSEEEHMRLLGTFTASGRSWSAPASGHRRTYYSGAASRVNGELNDEGITIEFPYDYDNEPDSRELLLKRQ